MACASLERLAGRFPRDFVWGVATSAFQIEGAVSADGRSASIWDEFCRRPGVIADGSYGDIACDHYHRLESDLDLIARLGAPAYRFSVSWPRIHPQSEREVNEPGLAFYERLVDGLLARGIEPYLTLYHWDLPARLQSGAGGWADRDTARHFADYAATVARRLGDRVKSFTTHNEPWVTATLGHEWGIFAPGIRNRATASQVSHHCLLSHGLAAQAIRSVRSDVSVGIVLNLSPVYPATSAEADVVQARIDDGLLVRWYLDALLVGRYPDDVLEHLGPDAPIIQAPDARVIAQPLDFLGVNYYNPTRASAAQSWIAGRAGVPLTDMGWEVSPGDLTRLLTRLDDDYRLPPLLVTENGAAYRDEVVGARVEDEDRRAYLETHIAAVADAIDGGVDVRGYFVWSLFDNFEWASGYSKRFGIVHVDYTTLERTPKRSAEWFARLLALSKGLPEQPRTGASGIVV